MATFEMNFFEIDFVFRFVQAMGHFLWLACLPWCAWRVFHLVKPDCSPALQYAGSLGCLLAMAALAPVAFLLSDAASPPVAASVDAIANVAALHESPSHAAISKAASPAPAVDVLSRTAHAPALSTQLPARRAGRWLSRWAPMMFTAYCLGVMACLLRFLRGVLVSRRLRRRAERVSDPWLIALASRLSAEIGLNTAPVVMWCSETAIPTVAGVLRPTVLLPLAWATSVPTKQLEHVLLHELTHLRRYDHLWNCVQNIIEAVLFFHPLIWIVSGKTRLNRELLCDDAVVHAGANPHDYALTLVDVAAQRNVAGMAVVGVSATAGRSQLRTRTESLLSRRPARHRWLDAVSLMAVLVMLTLLVVAARNTSATAAEQDATKKATAKKDAAARETVAKKLADIQPEELAGIVKDENGKPLAGVLVDAWTWHKGDETTTDADGVFRFHPESDGGRNRVEVRFSKPGYSPWYIVQQPVGVQDLVITLNNKTLLEGVLRAADGAPVAGVTVRGEQGPNHADGVLIGSVPTETTTDANGHYTLYVFPDTYTILVANKAGVARYENIVVAANKRQTLNIDLKPGIRFEANVIDAGAGEPFEGLVLYSWRQPKFRGTSNAKGKIVIEDMLPGVFEFNVGNGKPVHVKEAGLDFYSHGVLGRWWSEQSRHSHQRRTQTAGQFQRNLDGLHFDLRAGMKPVTIEIERGVELIGHVYDPDGKPVAGATVAPAKTGSGNSLTGDTRYSVKTENDGGYRVVMPAGNDFQYNLMAHDGGYQQWRKWAAGVTAPFESRPGQVITRDISLTRGATVKGKVVGKGDLSKHRVQAVAADMLSNRYYNPTVDVQPDGSFELKFIRPGKHHLQVDFSGTLLILDLAAGELREGVELNIDASPRFAPAP